MKISFTLIFLFLFQFGVFAQSQLSQHHLLIGLDEIPQNGEFIGGELLFYDNSKGALRGGRFFSDYLSPDSIGAYSLAFGINPRAPGVGSIALGRASTYGEHSVAIGTNAQAHGFGGVSIGYNTTSHGDYCAVLGYFNQPISAPGASIGPFSPIFILGNGIDGLLEDELRNAIVVHRNGNMAIGDNFPQARLHIGTGGSNNGNDGQILLENGGDIMWKNNAGQYRSVLTLDNDNNVYLDAAGTSESQIIFRRGNGLSNSMLINGLGQVGIGMTHDDALDVNGDIDATGCIQTGNSTTIGGACLSDKNLKKNINPMPSQLEKIKNLRPVIYEWIDNKHKGLEIGLIAQEVEEIFPDMIKKDDNDLLRIQYDISFSIRLLKTIQEQQEIIDNQQSLLMDHSKMINELKKELSNFIAKDKHLLNAQ